MSFYGAAETSRRGRRSAWLALSALAVAALAACRYDPVPQQTIDGLPAEKGSPSATHRPGQPCLACHDTYEGATPALAVGGTVFTRDGTGPIRGADHVLVLVTDATGDTRKACTNASGNFKIDKDLWPDATFPLTVHAGNRTMRSLIGRDGSCASCHRLPAKDAFDPVTGASRMSPGVILVDPTATDPTCGGAP